MDHLLTAVTVQAIGERRALEGEVNLNGPVSEFRIAVHHVVEVMQPITGIIGQKVQAKKQTVLWKARGRSKITWTGRGMPSISAGLSRRGPASRIAPLPLPRVIMARRSSTATLS